MTISTENGVADSEILKKPVDASIEVSVSSDKLQAILNIKPPENGGSPCNFPTIRKTLVDNGIRYGLDTQKLLSICENPRYNEDIIVAEGLAPIHGVDGSFDIKFNTKEDCKLVRKEDGSVDYYNLDNIENIKKDQLLCTIVHPKKGKDGMSVLGKKINHVKGKTVRSLTGKNTYLNKEGTEIRSKIAGQVTYVHGKIQVDETFYIRNDVDTSTGNIDVVGNVVVGGTVLPGFVVKATGNIQIEKGLSSVTLIAGGDIILRRGIIVGDISCDGDLSSKFIENCKVRVKGDIKTDYIMNSDVKCGKSLEAINSISKIVGGSYLVGGNIKANTIGSPANVKTYLEIGIDPKIIRSRKELSKELEALEDQSKSLESLISLFKKLEASGQLPPDKKSSLDNSIYSYNAIKKSIEAGRSELNELTELIKSKSSGRVICKGKLYFGTTVKIASARKKINDTLSNKSLYYSKGDIHIGNA